MLDLERCERVVANESKEKYVPWIATNLLGFIQVPGTPGCGEGRPDISGGISGSVLAQPYGEIILSWSMARVFTSFRLRASRI